MRMILFFSCCLFITVLGIAQNQNNWLWLNPYPQGNDLTAVFTFDQNSVVAVGNVGTFIRSTNGGNRWNVQSYLGGESSDLRSVSFVNPNLGWVVGAAGHVANTTDGGKTWTPLNSGTTQQLNSVFFVSATKGWIAGNGGTVLTTLDGGYTWNPAAANIYSNLNGTFFIDSLNGWMIGDSIYNSTDGGYTWKSSPSNGNELLTIYFLNKNIGWVAGIRDVLHTTNGGVSWTSQFPDITDHEYCSLFFIEPLTGWVATRDGNVFKTADGGANWLPASPSGCANPCQWSIRFANAQVGWLVGGGGKIFKSSNGGAGWISLSQSGRQDINVISLIDSRNAFAAGGFTPCAGNSYGTVSRTTNGGLSWTTPLINSGYHYWGVKFLDSSTGFVVGDIDDYYGIIKKTIDAGQSWTDQLITYTSSLHSVCFANKFVGSVVGIDYILSTTDGGDVWIQSPQPGEVFNSVYYLNAQYGWAIGSSLCRTTNGGTNWEQINAIGGNDVYFSTYLTGWIVGYQGKISYSGDGGLTWVQQTSGTNSDLYSVGFRDNCSGWAVGNGGVICHTQDGGTSWFVQKSGTSRLLRSVQFISSASGNIGWTAGEYGTILTTTSNDFVLQTQVSKGWNMVSLPVSVFDNSKQKLFPTSSSDAYEYHNRYIRADSLVNGNGFWLKFRQAEAINDNGVLLSTDTIDVIKGWNIIGSISYPVDISSVVTLPDRIISSSIYGYNGSYTIINTIQPGKAYWVKTSSDGKLILSGSGLVSGQKSNNWDYPRLARLIISEPDGKCQILYLGNEKEPGPAAVSAELPPIPPFNLFDARFESNRFIELYNLDSIPHNIFPIRLQSDNYPLNVRIENPRPNEKYTLIDREGGKLLPNSELYANRTLTVRGSGVIELNLLVEAENNKPEEYSLLQNYPNPFNPSTNITYYLPEKSFVTLEIFNTLGQKIKTLVDEEQEFGKKSVPFDASNIASGAYYYKLKTRNHTSAQVYTRVRKMILAK